VADDCVHRSTRHHRYAFGFLEFLQDDFGITQFSLRQAFTGVATAPINQAIEVCEWASRPVGPYSLAALLSRSS